MKESIDLSNQFKPKGKIKVELMDGSGEVIHKQETENFITKSIHKFYDHVMRNIFTRDRVTGGHHFYENIQDPFYSMVLTDATHPEDPQNEEFRAGDVIGYAHTTSTYSGSDILRGSYNASESFTNREQVHIVVDFPSHAGNGTFQSIYFSSEHDVLSNTPQRRISNDVYNKVQKHNGKIYASRSISILSVLDDDFNEIEQLEVGTYVDFWIVGNVIYYAYQFDITSAPLNDPTNRTLVVTLGERANSIVRHELSGRWYLKYTNTIYVYDSNWNLLSSFEDINGQAASRMVGVFDSGVVTDAGTFIRVGGVYDNDMATLHSSDKTQYRLIGFFDGFTFYHQYGNASNRFTFKTLMYNIGSRALLDEPVTKGNNQTMKITYDFMLPPMH